MTDIFQREDRDLQPGAILLRCLRLEPARSGTVSRSERGRCEARGGARSDTRRQHLASTIRWTVGSWSSAQFGADLL